MPAERVGTILRGCGLSAREIQAVDLPGIHALPEAPGGFGLVGPTGVGKTVALAKHLAVKVQGIVDGFSDPSRAVAPHNFAKWVNWPDGAEKLKALSGVSNWSLLEQLIHDLTHCGGLYLDDLGQERIRGEEDFALGQLRVVLDARYREQRPVFWTSNLGFRALSEAYGARTVSRMFEAWPPHTVSGNDLRMAKLAKQRRGE